jgi:hypothetical protein
VVSLLSDLFHRRSVMAASLGPSLTSSPHDTIVIQAHMNATTAMEALRRELLDAEALGEEFCSDPFRFSVKAACCPQQKH